MKNKCSWEVQTLLLLLLLLWWIFYLLFFDDYREAGVSRPQGIALSASYFAKAYLWLEISKTQHTPQRVEEHQGLWDAMWEWHRFLQSHHGYKSSHFVFIYAVVELFLTFHLERERERVRQSRVTDRASEQECFCAVLGKGLKEYTFGKEI